GSLPARVRSWPTRWLAGCWTPSRSRRGGWSSPCAAVSSPTPWSAISSEPSAHHADGDRVAVAVTSAGRVRREAHRMHPPEDHYDQEENPTGTAVGTGLMRWPRGDLEVQCFGRMPTYVRDAS